MTKDDELIEAVARALWAEMGPSNTGWTFEQDREDMEALARVAIETIRSLSNPPSGEVSQ